MSHRRVRRSGGADLVVGEEEDVGFHTLQDVEYLTGFKKKIKMCV